MEKKPFYKKWWFYLIVVLVIAGAIGNLLEEEPQAEEPKEEPKEVQQENKAEEDYLKEYFSNITEVRNDTTGKWRKVTSSRPFDIELAEEYHERFMKEDEIHFIISFATDTTTIIQKMSNTIYIEIKEYVDKEEHDAKKLGSGMLLKEYEITNGELTEIK